MGKLKNGKAASKGEITGEMIKVKMTCWWTPFGGCVIWSLGVVLCLL